MSWKCNHCGEEIRTHSIGHAECPKELTTLRERVRELEEIERHLGGRVELQRSTRRTLEERMANAAGKVRELARIIREMEANEEAWKLKESQITSDNLRQEARIRELEEAMSEVKEKLLEPGWPEDKDIPGIADIIEKVMKK